jgi:two-component sensor histidine kinase
MIGEAMEQHVANPSQVNIAGEEMALLPSAVLPLSLVLNELSTNATKYGAFSVAAGRVSLRWAYDREADYFFLWWEEMEGPPVTEPNARGFGSRLLERAIPRQLGGEGRLSFAATGVCYELKVAMANIAYRGPSEAAG